MQTLLEPAVTTAAGDTWIDDLRGGREEAMARLHALLLKAARFEVRRRLATYPHLQGRLLDDLAMQAADDAFVSVIRRLDDFRGASRFSTWAYKFGVLEAAVKVRRLAWRGREVTLDGDAWAAFADTAPAPDAAVEESDLLAALRDGVRSALSPHQRTVLVALTMNGVPIDVLADRLGTNRNALYKSLHDARKKLRAYLEERGFDV